MDGRRACIRWTSKTALEMGKSVFTSKVIIITALLPIFAFQKVEGKLFSPLAYTIGFALIGSLIISLTLIPMLCTLLLRKNIREKENPFIDFMFWIYRPAFNWVQDNVRLSLGITVSAFLLSIFIFFKFIGSEFLPGLNEGSIYVRATMPLSISLEDSYAYTQKFRKVFQQFPEVRGVMSQTGRPDDGTDPTGFFNIEFFVDLYQKANWKDNISKEELVDQMQKKLSFYRGVVFNFSQPISDNVEEAVSGVKGSMAIKIFGSDLNILDSKADSVFKIMKTVDGVQDLGVFRNLGQPEYRIELDQQKLAQFNISAQVCQGVIEMAIGGKTVSEYYEGEKKFAIKLRYDQAYRYDEEHIENLLVPTRVGTKIPLKELAQGDVKSGAAFVYRQANERFIALKFSVRGRDLGSTIKEAQNKVAKGVSLPKGYSINWAGEFENKERAEARLRLVLPISIGLIFLILLFTFRSSIDAGIIILNAPFAIIGGILSLYFRDMNFSISAGVGFIALFGIAIQDGIILVNRFKENLHAKMNIADAVRNGAFTRVRPVLMTALMAMLGLLPAALSTGIGSETQKPLATVVIGGLITSTLLTLLILPSIFKMVYSKRAGEAALYSAEST